MLISEPYLLTLLQRLLEPTGTAAEGNQGNESQISCKTSKLTIECNMSDAIALSHFFLSLSLLVALG